MSGCHHHGHSHGHDHGHGHEDGTGKTVAFNLTVNLLLTAAKWVAFFLTGSPSIFVEAVHSAADSFNPVLLWIGHRRGQRPPCDRHPYGHGRETFFWALIAALVMLVFGACLTAWRGLSTLISGEAPEQSLVSLAIMGFALLAEGTTLTLAWRRLKQEAGTGLMDRLRRSRNSVLLGVLLENGVDAAGVVLAFCGFGMYLLTGNPYWDAAFSLLIAAVLTASSLFLIWKNRSLLVGQTVPEHRETVRQAILSRHGTAVDEIVAVEVIALGPEDFRCRLELRLRPDWLNAPPSMVSDGCNVGVRPPSAKNLIEELSDIESTVRQAINEIVYVDVKIVL